MADLEPDIVAALAEVGIFDPNPADELHQKLVAALRRTRGDGEGVRLVALQWVFNWDLGRYGVEFAESKADYEALVAKHVVRFRDGGEKSGAMCEKRAEAEPDVKAAHLRYRLAEQLERLARKRLETIKNQIEVWRSRNADRRVADRFHTEQGT